MKNAYVITRNTIIDETHMNKTVVGVMDSLNLACEFVSGIVGEAVDESMLPYYDLSLDENTGHYEYRVYRIFSFEMNSFKNMRNEILHFDLPVDSSEVWNNDVL